MPITDIDKIDNFYEALLQRSSEYIGIFFVGVKTTSIFCISTCRARKPKKENVEFFNNVKEAMDYGYRPCKVCKPTENAHEKPNYIEEALLLVKNNPKDKIKDHVLREHSLSPEKVRRWFKKHFGMTFQAYQRMYRINNAFQELQEGKFTTHTAYNNGYESLSGFGYTFKALIGDSPKNSSNTNIIVLNRLTTPLGPMLVGATDKGICLLEFADRKMLETEFKDLQRLLKAKILVGENEHITQAKQELKGYFSGITKHFKVLLDAPGTEFQKKVWEKLKEIPYGETVSYQEQAERINNPKAIRAVASANGYNRISIIIPCHRVIGKDGNLTGYGGGLERKRWLLDHEKRH